MSFNALKSFAEKCGGAFRHLRGRPRQAVQLHVPTLHIGSDYGGYSVCPSELGASSVVYSFGIGEDVSFDLGLIERFGTTVYAFDPTPRSIEWVRRQELPAKFVMREYGLAAFDGSASFTPPDNTEHVSHSLLERESKRAAVEFPVRRLDSIMRELGHDQLDVLKMDIEGAEYDVIDDLVAGALRPRQLLLEFHHHVPGVALERTERSIAQLNDAGYRIFAVSKTGHEFSFMHDAPRPRNAAGAS